MFEHAAYLVCSLNVMDVKQVSSGVFDVGLSYDIVHNIYDRKKADPIKYPTIASKLNYIKEIADNHFEKDQITYVNTCINHITE